MKMLSDCVLERLSKSDNKVSDEMIAKIETNEKDISIYR